MVKWEKQIDQMSKRLVPVQSDFKVSKFGLFSHNYHNDFVKRWSISKNKTGREGSYDSGKDDYAPATSKPKKTISQVNGDRLPPISIKNSRYSEGISSSQERNLK